MQPDCVYFGTFCLLNLAMPSTDISFSSPELMPKIKELKNKFDYFLPVFDDWSPSVDK